MSQYNIKETVDNPVLSGIRTLQGLAQEIVLGNQLSAQSKALLTTIASNTGGGSGAINYNNVAYYTLTGATSTGSYTGSITTPVTITGGTAHSISYIVIQGTGTVNFGSGAQTIGAGESNSIEASTVITNTVVFTTVSADFVAKITVLS